MIFNEIFFLKGIKIVFKWTKKIKNSSKNISDKIFVFTVFVLVELGKQIYFLMGRKIIFLMGMKIYLKNTIQNNIDLKLRTKINLTKYF